MRKENAAKIKYNHFPIYDEEYLIGILIGIPQDISIEEINMYINTPLKLYSGNLSIFDLLSLKSENRNMILSAIEKYVKENDPKKFNGFYWDIVIDFICSSYNCVLHSICKELNKIESGYSPMDILNSLNKLRQSSPTNNQIRDHIKEWTSIICAYYKITEDILITGTGILCYVKKDHTYDITDVYKYYISNNSKVTDLKQMIIDITGVSEDDIIEIPLQIAQTKTAVNEKLSKFIKDMIKCSL